jgi:hypothetical protein
MALRGWRPSEVELPKYVGHQDKVETPKCPGGIEIL